MSTSALEDALIQQIHLAGLDSGMVREYRFHPARRWRFDFAFPARRIAIEVDGGVWARGRHTRGGGYIADAEKYNEAVVLGWRVLRVTRKHIDNGQARMWLEQLLGTTAGRAEKSL